MSKQTVSSSCDLIQFTMLDNPYMIHIVTQKQTTYSTQHVQANDVYNYSSYEIQNEKAFGSHSLLNELSSHKLIVENRKNYGNNYKRCDDDDDDADCVEISSILKSDVMWISCKIKPNRIENVANVARCVSHLYEYYSYFVCNIQLWMNAKLKIMLDKCACS